MDAIAQHGANAKTPHPARRIGDHLVVIVEQDAKAPVGQNLFDQTFEGQQVFLGHAQSASRLTADCLPRLSASTS